MPGHTPAVALTEAMRLAQLDNALLNLWAMQQQSQRLAALTRQTPTLSAFTNSTSRPARRAAVLAQGEVSRWKRQWLAASRQPPAAARASPPAALRRAPVLRMHRSMACTAAATAAGSALASLRVQGMQQAMSWPVPLPMQANLTKRPRRMKGKGFGNSVRTSWEQRGPHRGRALLGGPLAAASDSSPQALRNAAASACSHWSLLPNSCALPSAKTDAACAGRTAACMGNFLPAEQLCGRLCLQDHGHWLASERPALAWCTQCKKHP